MNNNSEKPLGDVFDDSLTLGGLKSPGRVRVPVPAQESVITEDQALSPRESWVLRPSDGAKVYPYVPGFGGHARPWQCKCVLSDEAVCGRVPEVRESERRREMRLRTALVLGAREARVSAWLAELAGHVRRRAPESERRFSEMMRTAPRVDRKLSDEESRLALRWARDQRLNKVQDIRRQEIAAQFWIELRQPPSDARPRSWSEELSQAWERARWCFRSENQPIYSARRR